MMSAQICLASASPRRLALLEQLGLRCRVMPAHVDERLQAGEAPADYVLRVALDKARAVAGRQGGGRPVLAADTAVVQGAEIFGKPQDADEACAMLARLSGATHEVYTAVAVADGRRVATAVNRSTVRFRPVTPAEARAYWATGEPRDKAGGYAIQGLGAVFVEHLEGSYSGVVGLPLFETARLLGEFGIELLGSAA